MHISKIIFILLLSSCSTFIEHGFENRIKFVFSGPGFNNKEAVYFIEDNLDAIASKYEFEDYEITEVKIQKEKRVGTERMEMLRVRDAAIKDVYEGEDWVYAYYVYIVFFDLE